MSDVASRPQEDYVLCPTCSPPEELDEFLARIVGEAASHRASADVGGALESPHQLLAALQRCSGSIARVEGLLSTLSRLRSRAQESSTAATEGAEDAWNRAATSRNQFVVSEPAPRERYAHYQLATIEVVIAARRAAKTLRSIEAAREFCTIVYRSLTGARYAIETAVRLINIEGRLEQ